MKHFNLAYPALLFGLFFCSLLCKEASIVLPLIAGMYFLCQRKSVDLRSSAMITVSLLFAALAYLVLRGGVPVTGDTSATLTDCLAGLGFYIGKMLYPFPLSFAITTINTTLWVSLLVLLFIPLLTMLYRRHTHLRLPLLLLTLSLLPPIYVMYKGMAWTPRYLYIPMAGFVLVAANMLSRAWKGKSFFPVLCLMMLVAIPTIFRVNSWTDPLVFWQDTINKSPGFPTPHLFMAAELIAENRLADAERHLSMARQIGITRKNAVCFAAEVEQTLKLSRAKQVERLKR